MEDLFPGKKLLTDSETKLIVSSNTNRITYDSFSSIDWRELSTMSLEQCLLTTKSSLCSKYVEK